MPDQPDKAIKPPEPINTCPESPKKPSNGGKQPTKAEQIAENVLKAQPELTKSGLSRELTHLGVYAHKESAYKMLSQSSYLRADLDKVQQSNKEFLSRKIVPKALKLHEKMLNDPNLDAKDRQFYIKLAEDKAFAEDAPRPIPETINIGQIQMLFQGKLNQGEGK